MTAAKRLTDIFLALLALPFAVFAGGAIAVALLATQGRPVLYKSERMREPGRAFALLKFRTMRPDPGDRGVTGGDKGGRITPLGNMLRRTRLDELPQLWNILRGDMSFVGPRPPLRMYVERFPGLYAQVLRSRPGVTGLATLVFHRREAELLRGCRSAEETDTVYVRRCVPVKARLDLIYQRRRNVCLDLAILGQTILRMMRVG